jgi:serine/threonine protein kinase
MKPPSHEKLNREETLAVAPAAEQEMSPARIQGQVIAERYELIEKLGSGGMSTVFKVRHIHLNKVLALKLLQQVSESSVQRFQVEARAATLLEHPNIIRVYDFGITSGQPYMAMDCIQGESLSDCLKKTGALPVSRLCRLFGQICGALAHAHEQGVVHRDLKPSNIILKSNEIGEEQAIVLDFGIAKILDLGQTPSRKDLTRTGDIFGTPLYMSPEQSQGQKVDARSDIYSLGCVMYEAATGTPPFQGDSVYEIIHKQITEAPAPFPEHLRKTRAGRRMEALILKSLAKSPADRQKYMLELASELKGIENDDGGLWSDLKVISSIFQGRLKAAERRSVLLKMALRMTSALACLLSVLLFILPGEISKTQAQLNHERRVIEATSALFDVRDNGGTPEKMFPRMKRLQHLCQPDPEQAAACREVLVPIRKALRESDEAVHLVENGSLSGGLGLKEIKHGTHAVVSMVECWSEAALKVTKIVIRAQDRISTWDQKLKVIGFLFDFSRIAAPFCELALAVLFLKRWRKGREVKAPPGNAAGS